LPFDVIFERSTLSSAWRATPEWLIGSAYTNDNKEKTTRPFYFVQFPGNILPNILTWRTAKNRHCDRMTNETETQAKAGAAIIPVTLFQQNCMLLWEEATKKAVVIDPGGDVPQIQAAIKQAGVTVSRSGSPMSHRSCRRAAELRDA